MTHKKTRNDIILIVAILTAIIICFIFLRPVDTGNYAVVIIDGKQTAKYSLSSNIQTDIVSDGINRLVIENGEAYISYADCRTNVCVNTGKINKIGQSIVCLPHKLIIGIVSE